jgi:hypothetical protein
MPRCGQLRRAEESLRSEHELIESYARGDLRSAEKHFAAQGVIAGAYDVVIARGVESMSRVPMGSNVLPGTGPFGFAVEAWCPKGSTPI